MTSADARDDLLSMIGIENPTHASDSILRRIQSDINLALQKIWTMANPWWSAGKSGGILRGPRTITGLSLTHGATNVTDTTNALNQSLLGQTVRLGNDPFDNELAGYDAVTHAITLVRPYAGASAINATGTLYSDTIILPDAVMSVIPPVLIHGEHELKPLRSQRDVMMFSDAYNFNEFADTVSENRDIDVPMGFYTENYRRSNGKTTLRLRVSPLPDKDYILRFDLRLGAPEIDALDAITDIPIPQNYTHSVFLPILRYQFSTWKHVNFGNQGNEYKTQYDEAWQILAKLKPQPVSVGRVRVVYA